MKLGALAGLMGLAASAAHAEGGSCALIAKRDGRMAQTPLPGFDPSATSVPLVPPPPEVSEAMVVCDRATIVPEVTDYRVLSEMRVPLALRDGRVVVYLVLDRGQLKVLVPKGQPTAEEVAKLQARVDQMQTAMQDKK